MPSNLWALIDQVSWWLDDADERQTVLGDIQERGVTFAALLDVIGLVLLRQLQAWKSWRTWLLTIALLLPCAFLPGSAIQWRRALYMEWFGGGTSHQNIWPLVQATTMTFILAYGIGFSLGSLGRRTSLTVGPLLAVLTVFPISRSAPLIRTMFTIDIDMLGYLPAAIMCLAFAIFVVLPLGFGMHQSLRHQRIGRASAIVLGTLFLAFEGYSFLMFLRFAPLRYILQLPLNCLIFWPLLYTLGKAILPYRQTIAAQPGL